MITLGADTMRKEERQLNLRSPAQIAFLLACVRIDTTRHVLQVKESKHCLRNFICRETDLC